MIPKTIAFLHSSYPGIGGTETVSNSLYKIFTSNGIKCLFISWIKPDNAHECNASSTKQIIYLPDSSDFNSAENIQAIQNSIDDFGIDIILNQGPFWSANLDKSKRKCKIVSVLHYDPSFRIDNIRFHIDFLYRNKNQLRFRDKCVASIRYYFRNYFTIHDFNRVEKLKMQQIVFNSDAFVTLCDDYVYEFKRLYKIKENIGTLFSAIPNPLLRTRTAGCENKTKTVVYVGRLTAWDKRVDRLLRIWQQIEINHPDWNLIICGDGEEKLPLQNMCKDLHLKNVSFVGFCDPTEYYRKAAVICLTSSSEAWGMVLLEASLYGVVPIAFNVSSGISEIIEDGVNGFLVDPFETDAYIHKLNRLIKDENLRQTMSDKARVNTLKYQESNIYSMWLDLFNKL